MLTDRKRLAKLLEAESLLKRTTRGYTPNGTFWKRGMPLLWEVRVSLGNTAAGIDLARAHGILKETEKGYDPRAPRWAEAMEIIDRVEAELAAPPIPNLGPIVPGGKPLLLEQLTHETAGLFGNPNRYHDGGSHYPALDFGWTAGKKILAPEPWEIVGQSSARGADACYAVGESELAVWLGHIVRAPANGTRFPRGAVVATIAAIPGSDHGHLGIDARRLIGKDLLWGRRGNGPNYTFGSPTIGQQLWKELGT